VTIQDVGSIGELIAAIATVATLLYLASQIRSSTISMKAEARRAARSDAAASLRLIAGSDETAEMFSQGLADPKSLSATQKVRFQFLITEVVFGPLETAEREWRMGTTDREDLDASCSHLAPLLSSPGGQWFWERHREEYAAEFRKYIDSFLAATQ
jgi:hypothetical protein